MSRKKFPPGGGMFPEGEWAGDPTQEQAVRALLAAKSWVARGAVKGEAYGYLCLVCDLLGLEPLKAKKDKRLKP